MRAVALHADVLLVTSAVLSVNCVVVRGAGVVAGESPPDQGEGEGETFVIDSPVLPEELEALASLIEQARFPAPSGLLATHGDWDHLLGRLAFPGAPLGCGEDTVQRLRASAGATQRELRAFDEDLLIERRQPLALGSPQPLPVPGRCAIGARELELHAARGHTGDGMAIRIPWAGVLVAGDYLSPLELPVLGEGADPGGYLATLERLRELVGACERVVPGHGPVLEAGAALHLLAEDKAYLEGLRARGEQAELPSGRRGAAQRRVHAANVAAL